MSGQLLVLAKRPAPGRVKTRLCPPCTPRQAADLAAAALADTLAAGRRSGADHRLLAVDQPCTVDGYRTIAQRDGTLGERIAGAFADVAAAHRGPVLQIGMDTPQVQARVLDAGLARLAHVDAVLGPAEDGGWWALGLRDAGYAASLCSVPMSTPDTGRLTITALRAAGLRIDLLPALRDVDTMVDARAVARSVPHSRFAAALQKMMIDE